MTLDQLRYLVALSKHQSISKAADSLFISQSALSMSLMNIEKEIHLQLFYRTSKGITLTDEGRDIIKYAESILKKVEEMDEFIRSLSPAAKKTVKIASFPLFSGVVMPSLLNELYENFPGIEIESREYKGLSSQDALKVFLNDFPMDFVIVAYESMMDFAWFFDNNHHSKYCFEPLFQLPAKLYVSAGHPLTESNDLRPSSINDYTILVSRPYLTHLKEADIFPWSTVIPVDTLNNVERLLLHNNYCFLSPQLFEYDNPFVINGDIVALDLELSGYNLESDYALIYRSDDNFLKKVLHKIKTFLSSLQDYFV